MKRFVVIPLLVGCASFTPSEVELNAATKLCETRGGVSEVRAGDGKTVSVLCNDRTYIHSLIK